MSAIPIGYRRLVDFARALLEATADGRASWESIPNPKLAAKQEIEVEPSAFAYSSASGRVEIMSDGEHALGVILVLYERGGARIAELPSLWFEDEGETAAPWNATFFDLYSVARNAALGVDDTLNAMTSELGGSDDSPS